LIITRVAGVSHCTLMHGCGLGTGVVKGHPAIVLTSAEVATAWLET